MTLRDKLRRSIRKALKNAQQRGDIPEYTIGNFSIEHPQRLAQGDYSTSVAMQVASYSGRKPKTIAKILADELKNDASLEKFVDDIQVAAPGFINFYLSKKYLRSLPLEIIEGDYGSTNIGKGAKVNLEFVSVNPTGELHVGHARTLFYGDALARLLDYAGFNVTREYYINNARQSAQIKELGKTALGKGTSYKSPYLDKKIKEYKGQLKKLKTFGAAGHFLASKIQREIKDFVTKGAKVPFDVWMEEDTLYKKKEVAKMLKVLEKKKLVYEAEGAMWLKTKRFGDRQDQVLVRGTGEYTYFLSDIAYHYNKSKRNFSKLIDIWGADHQGHVKRMHAAMRILGIKNLEILIAQLVRLKGGEKLSKRKGNMVTVEDLITATGLDAVRFFYLTKSLDSQMEFDIALARKQSQKNPIFYIQYTHARTCSILRNAKIKKGEFRITKKTADALMEPAEFDLLRKLNSFPDIIEDTVKDYQVHRITTYLSALASQFNQFYRDAKVLVEDEELKNARLSLTIASGLVINQCLELLGINAPSKM